METVIKCAHCGAQIRVQQGMEIVKCDYCDSLNVIETKRDEQQQGTVHYTRELKEPELKFKANMDAGGGNYQGGHLWITDQEIYFQPHKFNIGDLSKRYVKIQDIIGYDKGALTYLTIKTRKGNIELAVWKKDEIINAIEQKKRKLQASGAWNVPLEETSNTRENKPLVTKSNKGWLPIVIVLIIILIRSCS